ncbi:MAG: spore coat protein U domain-containing protein [Proteobacteria bacterium]|nr:spore coat protein U domain-containing protein [Pseudomonadota bacterium]
MGSRFPLFKLALAGLGVFAPGAAHAGSSTGSLNVALHIVKSCGMTVGRMDFGVVGFLTPTTDATAPLNVTCTPNTPFTVALDSGQNFAGGTRQMKRISGIWPPTFPYQLYKDAGRTTVWAPGSTVAGNSGPTGTSTVPVYGRVTGLSLSLGSYADTVVVTLTF